MKKLVGFLLISFMTTDVYADQAIMAKVNGTSITASQVEEEADRLIPRSTFHGSVSEERRDEFREKALNNLIDRELQYQDALAKGMKPDKKKVKERIGKTRDRFGSKKEYKNALKQAGIDEDQLKAAFEKIILIEDVIKKTVTDPSVMNEEMLRDYYEKNRDKFRQPDAVRLKMFSSKDEARAREALDLINGGADFSDIAARLSEDNYRIKGGDIGYIHKGRIYPEIEEAAFRLKPGETSTLIKAEGTWFIIKVEDKQAERPMTFEESQANLKKELETKRSAELLENWMTALKSKAKIERVWNREENDKKRN